MKCPFKVPNEKEWNVLCRKFYSLSTCCRNQVNRFRFVLKNSSHLSFTLALLYQMTFFSIWSNLIRWNVPCLCFTFFCCVSGSQTGSNDTQKEINGKSFMNLKWDFDKNSRRLSMCMSERMRYLLPRMSCKHNKDMAWLSNSIWNLWLWGNMNWNR